MMIAAANLLVWAIVLVPSAMLGWFALEVVAGLPRRRPRRDGYSPARYVVVVPAHNEETGIGATLAALSRVTAPRKVLVVADNCTDATARIAQSAGVSVIQRREPTQRGKGFALAFARKWLAHDPPDAVIVLDADCRVTDGRLEDLAARAVTEACPIQALNLQLPGTDRSPMVSLGAFAFLVMNVVRARGLERIAGGSFLQGTGMAIPWQIYDRLALATDNPVEDADLTLQLTRMGLPVRLDQDIRVVSHAGNAAVHLQQRSRWEIGFVRLGLHSGIPSMLRGLGALSRLRSAVAAHFLVPPLALLLVFGAGSLAIAMVAAQWLSSGPAILMSGALTGAMLAVILAWLVAGRDLVPLRTLAAVPRYILWKLPIYRAVFSRRPLGWKRTDRVQESARPDE